MITTLEISNFKCFDHLRLGFGSLTLLTGFNGAGKSTAIQPLLLLAQSRRVRRLPFGLALNGALARLGTFGDVLRSDAAEPRISFKVGSTIDEKNYDLIGHAGDRILRVKNAREVLGYAENRERIEHRSSAATVARLLAGVTYLSAVREGTADAYPVPDTNIENFVDVGMDGRFAPFWYDQFVDIEVPKSRCHSDQPGTSLRKQIDAWIGTLFPGAQANVQMSPQISLLSLQFRLSEIGSWHRPANIGYGLTYAFPVLVALLLADPRQVVIVDSPEAHLHPSAQSRMGRLLAQFAAAGVQIIVETHSDHLLNGARLAVKEKLLSHTALKIHFFTGTAKRNHGVVSPVLDARGRIDEWPEGFFDQSEKDLLLLSDLQ